jgi:peptidoglycan/LPS O-acetylase OafA/YrhL
MDKQVEMTTELRRARGWILGVGTVMLVYNLVAIHVVNGARIPDEIKTRATAYMLGIFMFLLAMWWLAGRRPVLACVLALLGFWGLALYMAMDDGSSILQGIVVKVLFTLALIRGIKSASRAEQLKRELAQVFS